MNFLGGIELGLDPKYLILEFSASVLQVGSALSFRVVPAKNCILIQITIRRKLLPTARFILRYPEFHRKSTPGRMKI
jgi:hypothetical protein